MVHRLSSRLSRPAFCWLTQNHTPTNRFVTKVLRALRRVVRMRRRLMKLAPELYDEGVRFQIEQERRERAVRQKDMDEALHKVYGTKPGESVARGPVLFSPTPFDADAPRRSARQKERIAWCEAERDLWMGVADDALAGEAPPGGGFDEFFANGRTD